jgi:hypothetical protein
VYLWYIGVLPSPRTIIGVYDFPPPAGGPVSVKSVQLRSSSDLAWLPGDEGLRALRVATEARDELTRLVGHLLP